MCVCAEVDCRAEINCVFGQPGLDDAQLLSGLDLVALRSAGPRGSTLSDAGMEILLPPAGSDW